MKFNGQDLLVASLDSLTNTPPCHTTHSWVGWMEFFLYHRQCTVVAVYHHTSHSSVKCTLYLLTACRQVMHVMENCDEKYITILDEKAGDWTVTNTQRIYQTALQLLSNKYRDRPRIVEVATLLRNGWWAEGYIMGGQPGCGYNVPYFWSQRGTGGTTQYRFSLNCLNWHNIYCIGCDYCVHKIIIIIVNLYSAQSHGLKI